MTAGASRRVVLAALVVVTSAPGACGGRETPPPVDTAAARADSARRASAAESTAALRDEWNKAEVVKRLTEAGLVVRDERKTVRHAPLSREGEALTVSGSELRIFVYPDAASRRRDAAGLDTTGIPGAPLGTPQHPRFILVNNLIAIHVTPNERLAERVADALTARHLGTP